MNNTGKVESINGNQAVISVVREGSCGENCAACKGCTAKTVQVVATCDIKVNVGDLVEFSSNSGYVYLGLVSVFLFPVILPLFTYIVLASINNAFALVFSVAVLFLSLCFVFYLSKSKFMQSKLKPRVIAVINKY